MSRWMPVLSQMRRHMQGHRPHAWWLLLCGLLRLGVAYGNLPPELRQPETQLSPTQLQAYAEVLKLRPDAARALLRNAPATAGTLLVLDAASITELLVTQDASRYAATVAAQDKRLAQLEKMAASGALPEYARAEIQLHQAAAQVLFGHEVQGAWSLRQAYQQMAAVVKRYPHYLPARKTLGLMQFFIGSLPEGYRWFLKLLGLPGSVAGGLSNLRAAACQPNDFRTEARVLLALVEETYYKKPDEGLQLIRQLHQQQPDNLLFAYLLVSLHKKQHHTEAALAAYRARPTGPAYVAVPYLRHIAADLLLYQGEYAASRRENELFLQHYKGQHYRKDAWFKLYLAAWLGGDVPAAARYRSQIAGGGQTIVEEDTYAQRFIESPLPLNATLTRARLQIDGGYYREALATLASFRRTATTPLRDQLEEPYRRARAWHLLGRPDSARLLYARTIALAGNAPYYFAPQAALQLGYLYQLEGQRNTARRYFQKALSYSKHEYKNSTDTKAKLALQELE